MHESRYGFSNSKLATRRTEDPIASGKPIDQGEIPAERFPPRISLTH
jgi:hypothetical protein